MATTKPRSKTWLTSFDRGCCRRPTTRSRSSSPRSCSTTWPQEGVGRSSSRSTRAASRSSALPLRTTPYRAPAQPFRDIHDRLAQQIRGDASCAFNNALVEHYTNVYATMKRHSDQALDLADESSIAVYSCYRDPRRPSRRLIVKSKQSDAIFEILLAHGSVVAFPSTPIDGSRTRSRRARTLQTTSGWASPFGRPRRSCALSTDIHSCRTGSD